MTAYRRAYDCGFAYALGVNNARGTVEDEAKWVTVKPNGAEHKGRPLLIDSESGQVLGGIGGGFNGKHISEVKSKAKTESQRKQKGKGAGLDFSLPDKIDKSLIIQNRDRSTHGSLNQMRAIAEHPDYNAVAPSRDFANGAPVVAYGSIPAEQMGKVSKARASDGTTYDVQYAVIDAGDCLTSHNAQGDENREYFSDDASKTRAIAGNGRVTGLQEAYRMGNAEDYKRELAEDPDHGVDSNVIKKMKQPILVRVMQPKNITPDIGDKSNTSNNLAMTATERAFNDSHRVDFNEFSTDEDGDPTEESVLAFISKMPLSERGELLNSEGSPTRQAYQRLNDAAFAKGYQSEQLSRLNSEDYSPKAKSLLRGLQTAAVDMAKLEGLPDGYDIRELIAEAALQYVQALKRGQSPEDLARQTDMFKDPELDATNRGIIKIFADNRGSRTKLGAKLKQLAGLVYTEGTRPPDIFGSEKPPVSALVKSISEDSARRDRMSARAKSFWRAHGDEFFNGIASSDTYDSAEFFKKLKKALN